MTESRAVPKAVWCSGKSAGVSYLRGSPSLELVLVLLELRKVPASLETCL